MLRARQGEDRSTSFMYRVLRNYKSTLTEPSSYHSSPLGSTQAITPIPKESQGLVRGENKTDEACVKWMAIKALTAHFAVIMSFHTQCQIELTFRDHNLAHGAPELLIQ